MRFAHQPPRRMRNWNPVSLLAQRDRSALQVLRGQHEVDAEQMPTSTTAVRKGSKDRLWMSEDNPALKCCSEMGVEGEHPQSPCGPKVSLALVNLMYTAQLVALTPPPGKPGKEAGKVRKNN